MSITTNDIDDSLSSVRPDQASLYRTRWLMAHNALHDLVHKGGDPQALFEGYLRELRTAEAVAAQPI